MASTVILDWDGTTFIEATPLGHTSELVSELHHLGHKIVFVTNNSSRGTAEYQNILERNGLVFDGVSIVTSNLVAIHYLKEVLRIRKAFILGNRLLRSEFAAAGILHTPSPQAVVVAFDTSLTYTSLQHAHVLVGNGLPYLATHSDPVCPAPNGTLLDCGSLLAALERSTGRSPIVLGKPEIQMCKFLQREHLQNSGRIVVVGDRPETDGQLAQRLGAAFLLANDACGQRFARWLLKETLRLLEG
jgi:HAD superfamily hydrolase (TIGR01450 family)